MTLVEVVMATGILGIVAGAIIGTFNCGFFILQAIRYNQRATQILMEKVETIRLYNWTQVNTSGFIPSTFWDDYDPQGAPGKKGVRYYGYITLSSVPWSASYSTNMKQINISLLWNSKGRIQVRRATTYIAKDGVQNYVY